MPMHSIYNMGVTAVTVVILSQTVSDTKNICMSISWRKDIDSIPNVQK